MCCDDRSLGRIQSNERLGSRNFAEPSDGFHGAGRGETQSGNLQGLAGSAFQLSPLRRRDTLFACIPPTRAFTFWLQEDHAASGARSRSGWPAAGAASPCSTARTAAPPKRRSLRSTDPATRLGRNRSYGRSSQRTARGRDPGAAPAGSRQFRGRGCSRRPLLCDRRATGDDRGHSRRQRGELRADVTRLTRRQCSSALVRRIRSMISPRCPVSSSPGFATPALAHAIALSRVALPR